MDHFSNHRYCNHHCSEQSWVDHRVYCKGGCGRQRLSHKNPWCKHCRKTDRYTKYLSDKAAHEIKYAGMTGLQIMASKLKDVYGTDYFEKVKQHLMPK